MATKTSRRPEAERRAPADFFPLPSSSKGFGDLIALGVLVFFDLLWITTHDPVSTTKGKLLLLAVVLLGALGYMVLRETGKMAPADLFSYLVALHCSVFVFVQFSPSLIFQTNTPAGGDMGAHVLGPMFMKRHLLPSFRLMGWSPDWFGGLPLYFFYFPIPALLIALMSFVIPYGVAFKLVVVSGVTAMPFAAVFLGRSFKLPAPTPALFAVASSVFMFDTWHRIYGGNIISTLTGEFSFAMSLAMGLFFLGTFYRSITSGRYLAVSAMLLAGMGLCHAIPTIWVVVSALLIFLLAERSLERFLAVGLGLFGGAFVGFVLKRLIGGKIGDYVFLLCCLMGLAAALLGYARSAGRGKERFGHAVLILATGLLFAGFWVAPGQLQVEYTTDMGLSRQTNWQTLAMPWTHPCRPSPDSCPGQESPYMWPRAVTSHMTLIYFLAICALVLLTFKWFRNRLGNQAGVTAGFGAVFVATAIGYLLADQMEFIEFGGGLTKILTGGFVGLLALLSGIVLADRAIRREIGDRAIAGFALMLLAAVSLFVFRFIPQSRLWNPRMLPFFYLSLDLLAAWFLGEVAISSSKLLASLKGQLTEPVRKARMVKGSKALVSSSDHLREDLVRVPITAAVILLIAFGAFFARTGKYLGILGLNESIGPVKIDLRLPSPDDSRYSTKIPVADWARWNFSGYENKPSFPEYKELIRTMQWVGDTYGCGRAHWEYEAKIDRFGTPMAPMLIPFWTDSCVGSMEGLYFETSGSTPFHFINQAELGLESSHAMGFLLYPANGDVEHGIEHLQTLGVRYFIASSKSIIAQANLNPNLELVANSCVRDPAGACTTVDFHIYLVKDPSQTDCQATDLVSANQCGIKVVEPLKYYPAVVEKLGHTSRNWHDIAVTWYCTLFDPLKDQRCDFDLDRVYLAAEGPPDWPTTTFEINRTPLPPGQMIPNVGDGVTIKDPQKRPVEPFKVTNTDININTISFDVDQIGRPVVIRTPFFPNWKASGAKGPYRVTPNVMVVVPTSKHVELSFQTTGVDRLGWTLTLVAVPLLLALVVASRKRKAMGDLDADLEDVEEALELAAAEEAEREKRALLEPDTVSEPDQENDLATASGASPVRTARSSAGGRKRPPRGKRR